jgi:ATP-dependent exoDNAse (exonuclease V) alpha subunit
MHKNLSREMIYTGMTRAKEELVVFYSSCTGNHTNTVARAVARQEIKGATWREKAASYAVKQELEDTMHLMQFPSQASTDAQAQSVDDYSNEYGE